jgi:hypothetical protein
VALLARVCRPCNRFHGGRAFDDQIPTNVNLCGRHTERLWPLQDEENWYI